MGGSTLLTAADKANVKKALPSASNKIVSAAAARVYTANAGASTWNYSGATGALTLVVDKAHGGLWFRVVDPSGSRGVVWEHELPNEIEYNQDKPFFHSWAGDDAVIAFVFASETEGHEFYKKVANRGKYMSKATKSPDGKKESLGKRIKGRIDKAMIGKPTSFKHVSHMGYDAEKGFSSHNVDKSWQVLLEQLSMKGVSAKDIEKNEAFIKDYVAQQGGIDNILAGGGEAPPPVPAAPKRGPPPPPTSRRKPAPPPPRNVPAAPEPEPEEEPELPPRLPPGRHVPPPRAAATPTPPPPPPPAPPARHAAVPPPPPPPPTRTPAAATPPPPPPPPPARTSAAPSAPPPPPPPPGRGPSAPPPPPPPPPSHAAPPPPPPPPGASPAAASPARPSPMGDGGGRSALLASIQGQSVHKLKKVDSTQQRISPAAAGGIGVASGAAVGAAAASAAPESGGGGLADSLAAALAQRKQDLGDSDEEEDDSDDDW